jgi:hypothetical protein
MREVSLFPIPCHSDNAKIAIIIGFRAALGSADVWPGGNREVEQWLFFAAKTASTLDILAGTDRHAMAMVRRTQSRLIEPKMEFEAAIALDRNNARAYFKLRLTLILLGQPEAAISHIEKRNDGPHHQIGCGCISKPAGRPARRAASAGGSAGFQRLASKRQPLTLSASCDTR